MKNNDIELIHLTLDGDDTAFAKLVEKYRSAVHALVWRKIGDFHIAEEITQDVFLHAYNQLGSIKKPQSFASWLYVSASRRCLAWHRKKRLPMKSFEDTSEVQDEDTTYSQFVVNENQRVSEEAQRDVVKKLLAKLPESERTVLILHYFSEMSSFEIGDFLGVSANTIRSRLRRALQRLRKEEPMIREALEHFQISPNITDNIMREVSHIKPTTAGSKPIIPWIVAASSAVLILLMLGVGSHFLANFQKPYSFDAQSEMMVELIDTPMVLNLDMQPGKQNQFGNANGLVDNNNIGQKQEDVSFAAAQNDGVDASAVSIVNDVLPARQPIRLGKGTINGLAYIAEGTQIAVASSEGIWIYDATTYQTVARLNNHEYEVTSIEISGDGNTLATGDADGTVLIWDANTMQSMQHISFIDIGTKAVSLGLNERGDIIATLGIVGIITIFDAKTGEIKVIYGMKNMNPEPESYTSLDLDPTGDILTTGDVNSETIVRDTFSEQRIHELVGDNMPVNYVAFSSDGNRLASGYKDGSIHIWDPKVGKRIRVLKGEMTAVNKIAFSPDDNIIAGGCDDGTIHLWFVDTGALFKVLRGHAKKITAFAFSPDLRTLASGSLDGNLHIWDITSGKTRHTYREHLGNFRRFDVTRNGKTILAHSKGGVVSIWDTETGKTRKVHSDKELKGLLDCVIHPNGHTFAIRTTNNTVSIWDTETGEKVNVYEGHTTPVNRIVYSSDGKFIVSASRDGKIHIWNADTIQLNRIIDTNLETINRLIYSSDGKTIALLSNDMDARLWNVETGELKYILRHETRVTRRIASISMSADSKMLVTAAGSHVYLWDIETGELIKILELINPYISSMTFTPNPNMIAVGDAWGYISLVDVTTGSGTELTGRKDELIGRKDGIRSESIASKGDTIVSRSSDGVIILWDDNQ